MSARLARGALWAIGGQVGRQGLFYLALLLIARTLDTTELGRFLVALGALQLLVSGAVTGPRDAAARYVAWGLARRDPQQAWSAAWTALGTGLAVALPLAGLVWFGAPWLTRGPLAVLARVELTRAVALALPGLALVHLGSAIARGYGKPGRMVAYSDILWPGLLLALLWLDGSGSRAIDVAWQVVAVSWLTGVLALGDTLLLGLALVREAQQDEEREGRARDAWVGSRKERLAQQQETAGPPTPPRPSLREQLQFALPLTLAGLVATGLMWVDHLILGAWAGAPEVGVYGPAARTAVVLGMGLRGVNAMLGPQLARHLRLGELNQARQAFATANRWALSWALAGCGLLVAAGRPLLRLFGSEFSRGWPVLLLLSLGWLVNAGVGSVGQWLKMRGRPGRVVAAGLSGLVSGVALSWWLIPRWGALGAAVGSSTGMALHNLLMWWWARWETGGSWNPPPLRGALPLLCSPLLGLAVERATRALAAPLQLALCLLAGLLPLLLGFRWWTRDSDRHAIRGALRGLRV